MNTFKNQVVRSVADQKTSDGSNPADIYTALQETRKPIPQNRYCRRRPVGATRNHCERDLVGSLSLSLPLSLVSQLSPREFICPSREKDRAVLEKSRATCKRKNAIGSRERGRSHRRNARRPRRRRGSWTDLSSSAWRIASTGTWR